MWLPQHLRPQRPSCPGASGLHSVALHFLRLVSIKHHRLGLRDGLSPSSGGQSPKPKVWVVGSFLGDSGKIGFPASRHRSPWYSLGWGCVPRSHRSACGLPVCVSVPPPIPSRTSATLDQEGPPELNITLTVAPYLCKGAPALTVPGVWT